MDPSLYKRIKELFAKARELSGEERVAFLDAKCGDDEKLRRELEELLASDERALGGALGDALREQAEQTFTPRRIGNYVLRELIGEGGMGEVYLADQEQPTSRARTTRARWTTAVRFS